MPPAGFHIALAKSNLISANTIPYSLVCTEHYSVFNVAMCLLGHTRISSFPHEAHSLVDSYFVC